MYARFYRWAMDRVDKNGIIALITNRSFINSRTFDGFRKTIQDDFQLALIIDTKSDVRMNPKIAGTTHNVFGIQTGVAIMFIVRKDESKTEDCQIFYAELDEYLRKEQKLQWFNDNRLEKISFQKINPDKNNNWINLTYNDFDDLLPVVSKDVRDGKNKTSIFELFSLGINTGRDEWSYDFSKESLEKKMKFFTQVYNKEVGRHKGKNVEEIWDDLDYTIKWASDLRLNVTRGIKVAYDSEYIVQAVYRPFTKMYVYFNKEFIERRYQIPNLFGFKNSYNNLIIYFSGISSTKPFSCLVYDKIGGLDLIEKTQCVALYRYNENGERIDNITNWGLEQFVTHYKDKKIKKEDIFHYVYGVLHNPAYRKKYELNLKREFPRIPFYKDFWHWTKWGKQLMDLHINYEEAKPYPLTVIASVAKQSPKKEKQKDFFPKVKEPEPMFSIKPKVKVKLKADKQTGEIEIDEITKLKGIPKEAWEYKLGNRSALEWILDQYKEKKPKDKTIAEKFNTYRFADYKEHVIELLQKVTTVSVETMKVVREMEKEK